MPTSNFPIDLFMSRHWDSAIWRGLLYSSQLEVESAKSFHIPNQIAWTCRIFHSIIRAIILQPPWAFLLWSGFSVNICNHFCSTHHKPFLIFSKDPYIISEMSQRQPSWKSCNWYSSRMEADNVMGPPTEWYHIYFPTDWS